MTEGGGADKKTKAITAGELYEQFSSSSLARQKGITTTST